MNVQHRGISVHAEPPAPAREYLLALLAAGKIMGIVEELHGPDRFPRPIARVLAEVQDCEGVAGYFVVRCPFCSRQHGHSGGPGHRVADCSAQPAFNRGYYVLQCPDIAPAHGANA